MKALGASTVILLVFSPFLHTTAMGSECTLGLFSANSKQCTDKFFDKITKNSTVNCSVSYQAMASCIEKEKEACLAAKSISRQTRAQIIQSAQQFVANEDYYCRHDVFNPRSLPKIPGCKKKFYKKVAKCEKRFYSSFDKQGTNSVDLCRSFSKAKRCMKNYLGKLCQPNEVVEYKIRRYGYPYNPYCPGREDPKKETFLDQDWGRCTWGRYEKLMRNCTAEFVETLKQNGGKQCKSTFRKYQSCEKVFLVYCMNGFYGSADELNRVVDESLARRRESDRERLCSPANMNIPSINPGQCERGYKRKVEACYDKMSETYKGNRANPSLCREYAQAKLCAKNVTKAMCPMNTNLKAFMKFYYDKFNPFCSGLADPLTLQGFNEEVS